MESNTTEDVPLYKRQKRHSLFPSRGRKQGSEQSSWLLYVAIAAIFLLPILGFQSSKGGPPSSLFLVDTLLQQATVQLTAKQTSFSEAPELIFVKGSALTASTPPVTVTPQVLGAIVGKLDSDIRAEITRYVVEEGDTFTSIAEKFGISTNTIVWANELANTDIKPGQELIILPVTGALHLVRSNDTLSEISLWYQASIEDIADLNGLSSAREIFAGDLLIIPNGVKPKNLPRGRLTPLANSYFIYPIPAPHRITQALHPFNAIDFSNAVCGESVYAAAGGTVQRTGYMSIGGRYVRIIHPNGVVTYYGHMSSILVRPGERVLQGQILGYTGYSGYTVPRGPAGCHLHFEVRGAVNPFR